MESVYGDRNHEERTVRTSKLFNAIKGGIDRGGAIMIPAFSLERTQEMLFELNDFMEHRKLPWIPVYVDSPLAIKATNIYKQNDKYFNKKAQSLIKSGDDLFRFPGLKYTETKRESMAIWNNKGPKIIIAGSGMANGGRIVHHLKHYLSNAKNTVLLVGYEAVGTVARHLLDGAKSVELYGDDVKVKAKIEHINGYSAHKDSDRLIDFVAESESSLKEVFIVMGELRASLFLAQRLHDFVGVKASIPEEKQRIEIDF